MGPGWQVPFAEVIRKQADVLTAAVGSINEPHQAEAIIAKEQADLVLLATKELDDPYWPLHASQALTPDNPLVMPAPYDYVLTPHRRSF